MFFILGVDFGAVSFEQIMYDNNEREINLLILYIFPAIAALFPSAIIGFIANFFLEEKFKLQCDDSLDAIGTNICSIDGSGCCEIVSSHDVWNSYTFIGGLASNILATWAIIR